MVFDNGNIEEQKIRRQIIREVVFKFFNGFFQKLLVSKKKNRYNGAVDIQDLMIEVQNCIKIVYSDAVFFQGFKISGKD